METQNCRPLKQMTYAISRMMGQGNCTDLGLPVDYLEKGKIKSMTLPRRTVSGKNGKDGIMLLAECEFLHLTVRQT